jgi:Coenzyme PQQ synthesis protein D (PqqD)
MTVEIFERATELLEAELGDELVALSIEDGNCFGFNSVATSVWRALEKERTFEELQAMLLAEYEISPEKCASELKDLLGDLVDKQLVRARMVDI